MANNNGIGLTRASTDPAYNQHLQQVASWAFVIDQGRLAGEQDALRMSQLFEAASYLGVEELTYDSMVAVVNEAKRREALGMVVMSTTNPYRQAADPFTKYQEAYRNIARSDMERLLAGLSEKERQMVAEQVAKLEANGGASGGEDSSSTAFSEVSEEGVPAELNPTQVAGMPQGPRPVPVQAEEVPLGNVEGNNPSPGDEQQEQAPSASSIQDPFPSSTTDKTDSADAPKPAPRAGGQAWFDRIGGHKIAGQKVMLYGQRLEGLGRAGRIASRTIRKRGGPSKYGAAKKVEGLARRSQKAGKLLQKGGKYLAAAQSIKEFASGDLKKSAATLVRTGGSIVITQLAFWISGLFGLTIKGLIVTAIVWNLILIVSKLLKLSIPNWMRWAIIIFDVAIPLLVAVIIILFFVASCYITKGNFIGEAFLALSSFFSSPASLFKEFCTTVVG